MDRNETGRGLGNINGNHFGPTSQSSFAGAIGGEVGYTRGVSTDGVEGDDDSGGTWLQGLAVAKEGLSDQSGAVDVDGECLPVLIEVSLDEVGGCGHEASIVDEDVGGDSERVEKLLDITF